MGETRDCRWLNGSTEKGRSAMEWDVVEDEGWNRREAERATGGNHTRTSINQYLDLYQNDFPPGRRWFTPQKLSVHDPMDIRRPD